MADYVLTMPDVGEGVAEAEVVEWHVKPGDIVREDMILAAVMTDKATIEIPSPVSGTVTWMAVEVGNTVAVKAPLVRIALEGSDPDGVAVEPPKEKLVHDKTEPPLTGGEQPSPESAHASQPDKPLASPAVRHRAMEAGIDLRHISGTGSSGQITHGDLDAFLSSAKQSVDVAGSAKKTGVEEIKITGLRRKIAEKMALSVSHIPHITYIEEVDVTDLEDLRGKLNAGRREGQPRMTILPLLMRALVKTIAEQPGMNATFDDASGTISRYAAVHIGIATQTPSGLVVPVVRHAEARNIWDAATELSRVADAARDGSARREELSGSTITISSLGALGGVASTPVINHPEVAIIGVNKIATRPVWDGRQFVPRKMMNLSSSFDHRIVDGWDAARFIQRIKALLETPALIFIES